MVFEVSVIEYMDDKRGAASHPDLARLFREVTEERAYQDRKAWGKAFDDRNTVNDWAAYTNIYLARATSMKATPAEQRTGILKAAAILVAALQTFDSNEGFLPRHYDPENPEATIPIDPTRARKGGLKLKDETKNQ